MAKHSSVPITMPPRVKVGDNISASWANSLREAVWRLTMRGTPEIIRPRGKGSSPNPFDVTLITIPGETPEDDPTFKIRVHDGWVNERIPGVQDPPVNATAVHKPWNILWGDDATPPQLATDRRTFDITIGQQVSILVNVAAEGNIALPSGAPPETLGPTEIAVEEEDEDSVYWVPPCADDEEGAAGVFHYKMAVLRDADATHSGPWLEIFLAGSHLDHGGEFLVDNVSNPAPSGSGRVVKEYKEDANKFLFRLIKEGGQLKVNEEEDGIEVRGNEVSKYTEWKDEGASEGTKLEFDDGLRTTNEDQTILLPVVVAGDGISVGIQPGTTKTYVVSKDAGDGWTGDALLRDCDGDPGGDPPTDGSIIFRLSIEDGQIVAVNASELERPLHENTEVKYVQSCCWIDDQDHVHEV